MFKLAQVIKIRKAHGLHGVLSCELLPAVSYYGFNVHNMTDQDLFFKDNTKLEIEKIFGIVKNTFKMKLKNLNSIEEASEFAGQKVFIKKEEDFLILEEIIGRKVKKGSEFLTITGIYDFNAGIVLDTEEDMILLEEVKEIYE